MKLMSINALKGKISYELEKLESNFSN